MPGSHNTVPRAKKTRIDPGAVGSWIPLAPQTTCPLFVESHARSEAGTGRPLLLGNYEDWGFCFVWHESAPKQELDWRLSAHPGCLELCLNLAGKGTISDGRQSVELPPQTSGFYFHGNPPLTATRCAGEDHRFIVVEFSKAFVEDHFRRHSDHLHPLVRAVTLGKAVESVVVPPERMTVTLRQLVDGLRNCTVFNPAKETWLLSKALEIASHLFFRPAEGELLCTRTQRLARDRVEKAKGILLEQMQDPPSLEAIARMVGCSPFYLSRQFTQAGGMTMQQYLRQIRMERAAELLRVGKCNVTEAALEVGYNSLSHFSSAFHEMFGCCPGLYPLRTSAQRNILPGEPLKGIPAEKPSNEE